MKTDEQRLLPHELAFGFFLILTLVRLIQAEGILGPHTLWLLILLAACGFVAWRAAPRPRLVFYAVVVQALYFLIRSIVDVIHPLREDALLERADLLLFGFNPNLALERFSWPLLSDVMSASYLFFFLPYLAWAFVVYYHGELTCFRRFCGGLFTVYALGFLGYTYLPAIAPFAAMADRFHGPLVGGHLTTAHHALVVRGTNGIDAFPSMHCALTSYVLFFDREFARRRFRVMLAPVALLWVATIYLRYHYVVDVVAGFAIAAVGLWAARQPGFRRFSRSRSFCS